jgi:hypothetical protein
MHRSLSRVGVVNQLGAQRDKGGGKVCGCVGCAGLDGVHVLLSSVTAKLKGRRVHLMGEPCDPGRRLCTTEGGARGKQGRWAHLEPPPKFVTNIRYKRAREEPGRIRRADRK